ncbi:MAG: glycosyltransferase family 9 protein [Desulfobulbaceae bacterium]
MDLQHKKILIVKPSSLGDIVHTLPVAHALKRCAPGCRIGWIVQKAFVSLLEQDPAVDQVYPIAISSTSEPQAGRMAYARAFRETVATLRDLRMRFRRSPYDLVLDLHASLRSGLLALTNPGGTRIGFADAREMNPLFQHQRIAVPPACTHAQEKNLLFNRHFGCPDRPEDFYLCTGEQAEEDARLFLARRGMAEGEPLVYLHAAARWQTKFWRQERWAALADRLHAQGLRVVFGGSGQDRAYLVPIVEKMARPAVLAAGELGLAASAALLKRSALYIGLDSGPMHMAALAGVPVVALFGPTHPERVGPYQVAHRIVRAADLACLGCRKRACAHLSCMEGIAVDMVVAAAGQLLGRDLAGEK